MDNNYYSIQLLLELVSLCLSIFIIYNNRVNRSNKGLDVLSVQTWVVLLSCLLETGTVIGRYHFEQYSNLFETIEIVSLSLHLFLYLSVFEFFYETISFRPKRSKKTKIILLLGMLLLSISLGWLLSGGTISFEINVTDGASVSTDYIDNIICVEYILLFILAIMAVSAIHKAKKAGKESDVKLAISALSIIVFHIFIDQLKNRLLPEGMYRVDAFSFALTYTFIFTIISTNQIVRQKSKEAAIQAELDTAKYIQQDALTKKQPAFDHFPDIKLLACMDAAKSVGGDFYDYFELDDENVAFLIADVSGKGVPAALFMMTAKNTIKAVAKSSTNPAEIMKQANEIIAEHNDSMMFVTVWFGIYNTVTHMLTYTNAGHNPPMLVSSDTNDRLLNEVHGLIVGADSASIYASSTLTIHPGDRLFLYTDGLTEAHNAKDDLFKEENVARILKANPQINNSELLDIMKSSVQEFCGDTPQFDDITMMVVDFDYERAISPDNIIDFIDGI